ncbi:hypothetical protein GALMADRAFT_260330 [Galerina marginata CBS 339.88]|uniref:Uncharacterized protein n=1 Tax=Galerina marginata (strain CBS 339.88) TaxID=685588 RepID=A0A067S2S6_GALM3|nr:hypothetical protein GALMADRAFT_260330 [Galerina marginata CBS 339.88]
MDTFHRVSRRYLPFPWAKNARVGGPTTELLAPEKRSGRVMVSVKSCGMIVAPEKRGKTSDLSGWWVKTERRKRETRNEPKTRKEGRTGKKERKGKYGGDGMNEVKDGKVQERERERKGVEERIQRREKRRGDETKGTR